MLLLMVMPQVKRKANICDVFYVGQYCSR